MHGFRHFLPILLLCTTTAHATVLLEDQFSGEFDTTKWEVKAWNSDGSTYLDGTQLRCFPYEPPVGNGFLDLTFSTYNPTATNKGDSFYGSQIISRQQYGLTSGSTTIFTCRGRILPPAGETEVPSGIVASMFLYNRVTSQTRDEIDVELLTKAQPEGSGFFTNSFVLDNYEQPGKCRFVTVEDYDVSDFHEYTIYWTDQSIEWFIDGQLVRREMDYIPTHDMKLYFNVWAPLYGGFARAKDSSLHPATTPGQNQDTVWQLDRVRVETFDIYDLNRDGDIASEDLGLVLANWGRSGLVATEDGDVNLDGRINSKDFRSFLSTHPESIPELDADSMVYGPAPTRLHEPVVILPLIDPDAFNDCYTTSSPASIRFTMSQSVPEPTVLVLSLSSFVAVIFFFFFKKRT